jgi:hypothetical protein
MDYSYIDKLLERYWQCATSLEEEEMLKAFFRQSDIPQRFEPYRSLFNYEDTAQGERLGADFDEKMLCRVGQREVKARRIPLSLRMKPLLKAAAAVAITLTLGNAAQHSFGDDSEAAPDYNYSTYKESYEDPQVAYDKVSSALRDMSEGLRQQLRTDTATRVDNTKSVQ